MRYFLAAFALLVVVLVSVAGFRGSLSRRPPLEVFPDMDRQPKIRPQTDSDFFANGMSSQLPVPGTVARGAAFETSEYNTGRVPGTTNFVAVNPVPITSSLLRRGQERYTIYCAPCHGATGEGNGITTKLGMTVIGSLHDSTQRRVIQMGDGQIFDTITHGKNLMGAYGGVIGIDDRWAIVAYVRALQRSRLGIEAEVPEPLRAALRK